MSRKSPLLVVSELSAPRCGSFRGRDAVSHGISRKQLATLRDAGAIELVLPDTYRMAAVPPSSAQRLWAALLWAPDSAAAGRSAGEVYGLEGVRATRPELVVPRSARPRSELVVCHRPQNISALMLRTHRGLPVTGVEATLVALGSDLGPVDFEIACEDARRRRLTSVPALKAYVARFGRPGRAGTRATRALLRELDPVHSSRSTLEVMTRRLLVANGFTDFVREYPLTWNGRTYRFDFGFERSCTILETNGRRWHDDANDYEHDNDKWSVPGRHGFRIVLATWDKVMKRPGALLEELAATLAA